MPNQNFRVIYDRSEFLALVGNINLPLLTAQLVALPLTSPIVDIRLIPTGIGVSIEWETLISDTDFALVDALIETFTGGGTTSSPFEIESLGTSTDGTGSFITKVDFTTPALDPGTYQVLWDAQIRTTTLVAGTGVGARITLTRSDPISRVWDDSWDLNFAHHFGGGITFQVTAGQTIRALLQFQKLGAPAVLAEMSRARVTIDKIS